MCISNDIRKSKAFVTVTFSFSDQKWELNLEKRQYLPQVDQIKVSRVPLWMRHWHQCMYIVGSSEITLKDSLKTLEKCSGRNG